MRSELRLISVILLIRFGQKYTIIRRNGLLAHLPEYWHWFEEKSRICILFYDPKRFMATTNKLKECLNYMRRPIHSYTLQMYWITNQFHFLRVIKIMTWSDLVWSRWMNGGLDKGISNFQSSQCSGCSLPLMTMTNYAIVGKLALVSQQQNALLGSSTYPYG